MNSPAANLIVSIGGGKGGVGKSIIASNLAVAFAKAGLRTVLIDADMGAANQHTLFGIDRTGPALWGFIDHKIETLEQALVPTCVANLSLLPGCGAVPGSANLKHTQKLRLIRQIKKLQADVVLIDVGAGIYYNVLDLYLMADLRLAVMLPQLTSFQNAYSFLKAAVWRTTMRLAQQRDIDLGERKETERLDDVLDRIQAQDPQLSKHIKQLLELFGVSLIGNQIITEHHKRTVGAISRMFKDFLRLDAPVLSYLRFSVEIQESINRRRPLLASHPGDSAARALQKIAGEVLRADGQKIRAARAEIAAQLELDMLHELEEPEPLITSSRSPSASQAPVLRPLPIAAAG